MSTSGITTRLIMPTKLGPVGTVPEMSSSTPTWEVVKDPLGSGKNVLKNTNRNGQSDAHSTQSTGRDLKNGSHSFRATGALYLKSADLVQTGRCLWFQTQMSGSPIVALSPLNGKLTVVDRVNGILSRKEIGPIPWGHGMYVVVEVILGSQGLVKVWYEVGSMPEQSDTPVLSKTGNTWQGRDAHDTIGQYAEHSKVGVYTEYIDVYGRGTSFAEALSQAGPTIFG